ncbi:Heterokaryon incompatibility protein het-c [Mycena indigotica]|uniref:Heterokaryon incompatibility protein het-c n=1 Tax=Mycena indigotica TaxID=2126181 RepID=A0A8H6W781_9AGAR|nr:Heterokaryon incompatibility protein het-c [Mycena indigotica]KAF7307412.1 Heterokaryon incompatibility protein het-c [Mycena indigotica]
MHTLLLIFTLVIVTSLFFSPVAAFGAGDIPDFAVEASLPSDKAFRHGDIENILSTLAKTAGHAALSGSGGNLFGFAKSLIKEATSGPGGAKFSSGDIKKVYFGNWLRDYSQAMDIGGLSKLTADTLVLVVSVLGFMTFGFSTEEFEVTAERLGVYLPVEHIDNPKRVSIGYAEKEGDARRFHPKLRPPVNPEELEIDERTGMKCYMATENRSWDTSTAHIRRVLVECIEMGRRARGRDGPELYEAYRLLGTGLHTLEDLLAHSNWVEIGLRKMGYDEVFCHVGDRTEIETPNGRAPPLVTGTFGGADFLHSLMGEAGDKLSQASVTDLASKMDEAQSQDQASKIATLKALLSKLPFGGGGSKVNEGEQLGEEAKAYHFNPNNVAPPEVQQKLLALLRWRDGLMRSIAEKMEMIPGLEQLMDQLSNALNAYVYTVIAPWLTPILQQATSVLGEGSKAVIESDDQYEVFNNPYASDPSHSLLSKDHFGLILNEPAGKIAILVVRHSVNVIVQAWSNNDNPNHAVDVILEAFHHPYYATGRSQIQNDMFQELERWIRDLDEDTARDTINALTKESVRNGKNKRLGSDDQAYDEPGYGGCGHAHGASNRGYAQTEQYEGTQSAYQSHGYSTYESEYGGNQQTFGAERLALRDEGYGEAEETEEAEEAEEEAEVEAEEAEEEEVEEEAEEEAEEAEEEAEEAEEDAEEDAEEEAEEAEEEAEQAEEEAEQAEEEEHWQEEEAEEENQYQEDY